MAYSRNYRNYNGYNKNYSTKRRTKKKKYTAAETVAFKLGQENRVLETIASKKDTRVADAYWKGYSGLPSKQAKKPLFSE